MPPTIPLDPSDPTASGSVPPALVSGTSALERALDRVGDRWSLLVIGALLDGELRFGELADQVSGIAPNILTDRLRRLEKGRVVVAQPYSTRPLRVSYRLTLDGQELAGVLRLLASWGSTHDPPDVGAEAGTASQVGRHDACGTPVEVRWYCPTCARTLDDKEAPELRYL